MHLRHLNASVSALPAWRTTNPQAAGLRVRVFAHASDIDPQHWDSIVRADDLLARHRFVRLCESSAIGDAEYRHVLLYEGSRLGAVASLCRLTVDLALLSSPGVRKAIRIVRRTRPSFLMIPLLLCGPPVSFGQSLLRFSDSADRPWLVGQLSGLMSELAQELGASVLCFKELQTVECRPLQVLQAGGYLRLPSLPSCRLPLSWASRDGYLGAMRAGYRRQAIADGRTARKWGLRTRKIADIDTESHELYRLYRSLVDQAEFRMEVLPRQFFKELSSAYREEVSALVIEDDDAIVGSAILLQGGKTLTFLLAGIDLAVNQRQHSYPFLVSEVVMEGIRRQVRMLELGQTSYSAKTRFGAQLDQRWLYLKHRSAPCHGLLRLVADGLFPARTVTARTVFRDTVARVDLLN